MTDPARYLDPGRTWDVSTTDVDGRPVLLMSRPFAHSADAVWSAITDPAQLVRWTPYGADRDLAATGPAVLTSVDDGSTLDGEVLVCEPPHVLEHRWGDDTVLRWELEALADGCRLTLRQSVAPDDDAVASYAAGWHVCLAAADALLSGEPLGPVTGENAMSLDWERLRDAYAGVLGTPAASSRK